MDTTSAPRATGGFSWRAALTGSLLCVFVSIWSQYAELVIHGTQISLTYPPIGSFLVFFGYILVLQWPLQFLKRRLALDAREMVMVWSMLVLAIGVASIDIAQKMPPMIAGTVYYATPENKYAELFLPHIKPWLGPLDLPAVRGLFEASANPVPWARWLPPLAAWSLFYVAAYWVMLCGVTLFRRQWVDHERLLFPLTVVPLEMIEEPARGQTLNRFFRSRVMWVGFALGALPPLYVGLHDYFPRIPEPQILWWGLPAVQNLGKPLTPFNGLLIAVLPLIIGLSYLLTREISLSLWAFYWLGKLEEVLGVALGVSGIRTLTGTESFPYAGLQTAGAYLGIALFSVWVARRGLRVSGDKQEEIIFREQTGLDRRVAIYGGLAGFLALVAFAVAAGTPLAPALVLLGMSFVYLLAMTRLMAEAGLPWTAEPDFRGHHLVLTLFPTKALRPPQWVATGMMLTFSHDMRVAPMPRIMQSFKMAALTGAGGRDLLWALAVALVISLPLSQWALINDGYAHGGVAINPYRFVNLAQAPGKFMEQATLAPRPHTDYVSLAILAYGCLKLLLLNFLRTTYLWWPLHPVGYAMSYLVYLQKEWFSVLIGWAIQTLVIRYGGHRLYVAARPLFLGLILGAISAGGFWLVLDGFTGLRDHKILY
jgi:hypothetical protein